MCSYSFYCILPNDRSLVIDPVTKEVKLYNSTSTPAINDPVQKESLIPYNVASTYGENGNDDDFKCSNVCKLFSDYCNNENIDHDLLFRLYSCRHIKVWNDNNDNNNNNNKVGNIFTLDQVGNMFNFNYCNRLVFLHESELRKVSLYTEQEDEEENGLSTKELNDYYISLLDTSGIHPFVSIRYVGENIGFGIFAEKLIKKTEFIGEYVGLVSGNSWLL